MVETRTIGSSMLSIHFVMRIISIMSIEHNQTLFLLYTHLQSYKSSDISMLQVICQLCTSYMIFVSLYNMQFNNLHNFRMEKYHFTFDTIFAITIHLPIKIDKKCADSHLKENTMHIRIKVHIFLVALVAQNE